MHPPPADPWGSPIDPVSPSAPYARPYQPPVTPTAPVFGRASAPVPAPALREPTAEMPAVLRTGSKVTRSREVSWERTKNESMRRLADGWGFTATGLIIAFCGWGLWAAAGRGSGQSSLPGLIFILVVGFIVFVVSRSFGYIVVRRIGGRPLLHARWTHFTTGLFLTIAGVAYFISTQWLVNSGDWVRAGLDWLGNVVKQR
jgi:hypothetical protein